MAAKGNTNCALKLGPGRCALESEPPISRSLLWQEGCVWGSCFTAALPKIAFYPIFLLARVMSSGLPVSTRLDCLTWIPRETLVAPGLSVHIEASEQVDGFSHNPGDFLVLKHHFFNEGSLPTPSLVISVSSRMCSSRSPTDAGKTWRIYKVEAEPVGKNMQMVVALAACQPFLTFW